METVFYTDSELDVMSHNSSIESVPLTADRNPPAMPSDDFDIKPDVAFKILSQQHHRFTLYLLEYRDETVAIDEIAKFIAAIEHATPPDEVTDPLARQILTTLHHQTLPRLESYSCIQYEPTESATLTDIGELLRPYLEFAKRQENAEIELFLEDVAHD